MTEIIINCKLCYKCNTVKHLTDFYKSKSFNRQGVTSQCKKCVYEHNMKYRNNHKDVIKKLNTQYYQRLKISKERDRKISNMSYSNIINYIENHKYWTHAQIQEYFLKNQLPVKQSYRQVIKSIEHTPKIKSKPRKIIKSVIDFIQS